MAPLSPMFPEIAALDLFASVVQLGSVSKAATAHGISQPSASSRIRGLERQLGVQLLDRSPSGSTPTRHGTIVAGWTDAILRAALELEAGMEALKNEQAGRLRIAASYTIAEYLLPRWLGRFLRDHESDTISLDVENSTAVLNQLGLGAADLGFIETPLDTPTMQQRIVGHDELVTVVASDHAWASRSSVSLAELATTPLVMREEGSGTRQALKTSLVSAGLTPPPSVIELGSTAAVRSAVMSGNSPTVISRLAVAAELGTGSLVEVPVDDLDITRELRAVWPRAKPLSKLAHTFLDSLEDEPL